MDQPTRLFDFLHYQLEHFPMDLCMTSRVGGQWKTYSTQELVDAVNTASRGLIKLGVQPGDKVALISHNNRCEWNIMDLAILQVGAIDVPIYPTMTEEDYDYILNHSESRFCFVSNDELYDKVASIRSQVPALEGVWTFEQYAGRDHWSALLELGADTSTQDQVTQRMANVDGHDLATIIYTSGTTGRPKGVMLRHSNIVSNAVDSTPRLPDRAPGTSRCLSFLPVCHIFERMLHYLYMYNGVSIYFAESLETIKEDLNYAKPHVFTAVPRLLEKFYDGIVAKGQSAGGIKAKLFMWAVAQALKWEPDRRNGNGYERKLRFARKLVFSKVKEALGLTEIEAVACGSAALQPRLARFFNGADIPVFEGYGLTETSPVISVNSLNQPGMLRVGSVGKILANQEVRIAQDGEILVKGPNVMIGYYKDQDKTDEVLKDGWFHTGDIGVVEEGFLRITDRKKEMFKTSGGKYVAPQLLENAFKESRFVEQCMVIGEGQKFPAVLIVPAYEACQEWAKRHNHTYPGDSACHTDKNITDRIWRDIQTANAGFAKWEQVKQMRVLERVWTIEDGELTPTLKLKRKLINKNFAAAIADIYRD